MSFFVKSEGKFIIIIFNHIQLYLTVYILFIFSILNKITPEKFQDLSQALLNVGLESPAIIKGVILLIFDKALEEPKYSSMYAQLCKKLSEEAPNFELSTNNSNNSNVSCQMSNFENEFDSTIYLVLFCLFIDFL